MIYGVETAFFFLMPIDLLSHHLKMGFLWFPSIVWIYIPIMENICCFLRSTWLISSLLSPPQISNIKLLLHYKFLISLALIEKPPSYWVEVLLNWGVNWLVIHRKCAYCHWRISSLQLITSILFYFLF